jgi:citrate synthase
MTQSENPARTGLDGIVVADTLLARVDGLKGRLVIRGRDLEDAAANLSFEGMTQLLWSGQQQTDSSELQQQLGTARVAAFAALRAQGQALARPDGMEALRAALSQLETRDDAQEERVRIAAALPVFAAAWARGQGLCGTATGTAERLQPIAPDPRLSQAQDYLRMLTGSPPPPAVVRGLDTYLCTVAEHGMNASTFAARVVTSTGSDTVSAVVAAICALKGPLHGGAPGPVLDMLEEVASPARARAWLEAELSAGRRIMGLGHRVYRVRDPRAAVLEAAVLDLEKAGISTRRLGLARAVEKQAAELLRERYPDRPLEANVEFYTAVLLDTLGLDRRLFTATFAVGRVAGWLAHIEEQRENGRLIRPSCRYVGSYPEQKLAPEAA